MTHHDSLDRDLPAWLADAAAGPIPANLLGAITSESRARRQQPAWIVGVRGESMGSLGPGAARVLRFTLLLALAAVVATGGILVAGMLKTEPQPDKPLAFIRDGDVYLAAADGSGAQLLLDGAGRGFSSVAWQPGGQRLALDGDAGAVVLDVTTGRTISLGPRSPVWSPDGQMLAVLDDNGGATGSQLRILDTTSFAQRAAYPFPSNGGLAWSPDGRWIAGTGGGPSSNGVLRIDVATGEVLQIAPGSGHLDSSKQVSWSPDSRHIAYIRYFDPGPLAVDTCHDAGFCRIDVWVAAADGSNAVRVNSQIGQADSPRWSPDGAWLSFRSIVLDSAAVSGNGTAGGLGIELVRPDGTDERTIVSGQIRGYRWLPAGDGLLVAQGPGEQVALWSTTLTGQTNALDLRVDKTGLTFDWQTSSR